MTEPYFLMTKSIQNLLESLVLKHLSMILRHIVYDAVKINGYKIKRYY